MQQRLPNSYTACHYYTYSCTGGHTTDLVTSFVLDWRTVPFAAKQGIPIQQSSQLIDGWYCFRKSILSITSLYKPSSIYSYNNTVTQRSPPSTVNVKSNICTSLHNILPPFATVTVSTAPWDGCASVEWTIQGWTKLCVVPLSSIHLTNTLLLMATNYNKLRQLGEIRSDRWAATG